MHTGSQHDMTKPFHAYILKIFLREIHRKRTTHLPKKANQLHPAHGGKSRDYIFVGSDSHIPHHFYPIQVILRLGLHQYDVPEIRQYIIGECNSLLVRILKILSFLARFPMASQFV